MAYHRTNWKSGAEGGTLVSKKRLDNIEDGIEQALAGIPPVALPDAVMTAVAAEPTSQFAIQQNAAFVTQSVLPSVAGVLASVPASNIKPVIFSKFRKALQGVYAGTGACRILAVGNSTTLSVIDTASGVGMEGGASSYPAQLRDRLAGFLAASSYALGIPQQATANDGRWVAGTGWKFFQFNAGFGRRAGWNQTLTSGGGDLVYTPGNTYDTVVIHYSLGASNPSSIPVSINGVAQTPINSNRPAGNLWGSTTFTVPTGSGAITIGQASGGSGGTALILGIETYVAAAREIRVMNAGVGSSTSADWVNSDYSGVFNSVAGIKKLAPDLTVIMLGINDSRQSVSVSSYIANVTALITAAKLSGDVILMSPIPSGTGEPGFALEAQYRDALVTLAAAQGCGFIDIYGRMGSYAANQAAGFAKDTIGHLTAAGYADIATAVFDTLRAVA